MSRAKVSNIVYFLCSPSVGILDNWLPVIWRLKEKREDLNFIIIFPKLNFGEQIHFSNILFILAAKIFDCVVFRSHAGDWLYAKTIAEAKAKNQLIGFEWFIDRGANKLKKWPVVRGIGILIQYGYSKFSRLRDKKYLYNWMLDKKHAACMLFDVSEESKPYNVSLMKIFKEIPKFSICHGIDINNGGVFKFPKKIMDGENRKDIQAYLFSLKEIPLYEHQYAIPKSSMKVVGIPRHSPDWMDFILSNTQKKNTNDFGSDYIFIISRPGNTIYHSYKSKKKALKDIKKIAWSDLKKKIVVKLHPKERKEGLYEEVFGTDNYGDKWLYSDLPPLVLGKECFFAVCFFSGVACDMIALGVPTIEYLDLRGIPECDNRESLRDKHGHPVFSYRYLNLVLGTSDYEQMRSHAIEIMHNREEVVSRLQARYQELFPRIKNINEVIALDILSCIGDP